MATEPVLSVHGPEPFRRKCGDAPLARRCERLHVRAHVRTKEPDAFPRSPDPFPGTRFSNYRRSMIIAKINRHFGQEYSTVHGEEEEEEGEREGRKRGERGREKERRKDEGV